MDIEMVKPETFDIKVVMARNEAEMLVDVICELETSMDLTSNILELRDKLKELIKQKMDEETKKELDEWSRLVKGKLDNLEKAINLRFDKLKKVIGDYLELSSNLSIATVKANLKNV